MKKHAKYLSYVVRHKWFVFVECCKLGVPWRGLIHDLSKFLPSEWFPYVISFYGGPHRKRDEYSTYEKTYYWSIIERECKETVRANFDKSWLLHQHRNPHHWQFWCLTQDEDEPKLLPMPQKYVLEMVADWRGAGKAQGHGDDLIPWYEKNRDKIKLHPDTRKQVEGLVYRNTVRRLQDRD